LLEQAALEEERRLMYVAMTRAREELYISRALDRFYF
jgi:DNA helicase-2/ATP-dependent DNA helicase PcrA